MTSFGALMQRHEMIAAMDGLGRKGMAGAFDEAVTTGLQRQRTTMEILTDLLRAEATHRHTASIRYQMSAAKLPVAKNIDAFVFDGTPVNEGLVRSLHAGSFLPVQRNIVLVGGTGIPNHRFEDFLCTVSWSIRYLTLYHRAAKFM
jgi:DNA replication protein DnaC